jgi:hypothetical protein
VQEMHQQIATRAGHQAVAEMFTHIDLTEGEDGRLQAEKALQQRRANQ